MRLPTSITLLLLASRSISQPPMPVDSLTSPAPDGPSAPPTFTATVTWKHDGSNSGFRVVVSNGLFSYTNHLPSTARTNAVQSINGTNTVSIQALNKVGGKSAPAVVAWTRSEIDIVQLWQHNASLVPDRLILSITNPVGNGLYSLRPSITNRVLIEEIR